MNVWGWRVLSALNRALLPKIHRKPDLERLSMVDKAIVGWKMWVTYRRLDAESAHAVKAADNMAKATLGK